MDAMVTNGTYIFFPALGDPSCLYNREIRLYRLDPSTNELTFESHRFDPTPRNGIATAIEKDFFSHRRTNFPVKTIETGYCV